jgi:hypothetical protein
MIQYSFSLKFLKIKWAANIVAYYRVIKIGGSFKVLIISLTQPLVNPEHSQRVYPELVKGLTFYSSTVIFAFNRDIMGRKESAGERSH